jgi:hypothetical protein
MAVSPQAGAEQPFVAISLDAVQKAGTTVQLVNSAGAMAGVAATGTMGGGAGGGGPR